MSIDNMFSPADWSNLMYTAPHAHGVRTFFNTDFPRPKILQIHNLSALNRRQLKLRIESLRQSTTENQLLAASCARCLLLSAIQCTVNHWFYITVSNMCKQLEELQSLPRNTMHKRGLCHHAVSVCLSVTFVDHVKMNRHIVKIFSPSGGHTILVFPYQMGWQYSDGNPPYGGVKCRWGRQKSRF